LRKSFEKVGMERWSFGLDENPYGMVYVEEGDKGIHFEWYDRNGKIRSVKCLIKLLYLVKFS
jgi:hypothetical protein